MPSAGWGPPLAGVLGRALRWLASWGKPSAFPVIFFPCLVFLMTCKPPLYMGPEYIKYFNDKTIAVSAAAVPGVPGGSLGGCALSRRDHDAARWQSVELAGKPSLEEELVEDRNLTRSVVSAHRFFPVCHRRNWSGTRGSLGLWSSLPIGQMTANHLLPSTLTSPSSKY